MGRRVTTVVQCVRSKILFFICASGELTDPEQELLEDRGVQFIVDMVLLSLFAHQVRLLEDREMVGDRRRTEIAQLRYDLPARGVRP